MHWPKSRASSLDGSVKPLPEGIAGGTDGLAHDVSIYIIEDGHDTWRVRITELEVVRLASRFVELRDAGIIGYWEIRLFQPEIDDKAQMLERIEELTPTKKPRGRIAASQGDSDE